MEVIRSWFDIREKEVHGTRLECGTDPRDNDNLIRSTLESCELVLIEPCHTFCYECIFDTCTIMAQKQCRRSWNNCRWAHCTFLGDYESVSFGDCDENCTLPPGPMLRNCDLSKTNLHECVVCNADLGSMKFPRWPNVTFLEPLEHIAELKSLTFPLDLNIWWDIFVGGVDTSYSAITLNWQSLVEAMKNPKYGPTELEPYTDLFRSTISRLRFVIP